MRLKRVYEKYGPLSLNVPRPREKVTKNMKGCVRLIFKFPWQESNPHKLHSILHQTFGQLNLLNLLKLIEMMASLDFDQTKKLQIQTWLSYKMDLYTGLARYSNGKNVSDCRMANRLEKSNTNVDRKGHILFSCT